MYAETFNVRPELEGPAKWLRWALQSLVARNTQDARWNLRQFWQALGGAKRAARTAQDWGDLLTLDAQSQRAYGSLLEFDALDLLSRANDASLSSWVVGLANPLTAPMAVFRAIARRKDPLIQAAFGKKLEALSTESQAAYGRAKALADQAQAAYRTSGHTNPQAANTATVAASSAARAADIARGNARQLDHIATPAGLPDLLGVPLWLWAVAGVGVALLLTAGPSIVAVTEARALRKATA